MVEPAGATLLGNSKPAPQQTTNTSRSPQRVLGCRYSGVSDPKQTWLKYLTRVEQAMEKRGDHIPWYFSRIRSSSETGRLQVGSVSDKTGIQLAGGSVFGNIGIPVDGATVLQFGAASRPKELTPGPSACGNAAPIGTPIATSPAISGVAVVPWQASVCPRASAVCTCSPAEQL